MPIFDIRSRIFKVYVVAWVVVVYGICIHGRGCLCNSYAPEARELHKTRGCMHMPYTTFCQCLTAIHKRADYISIDKAFW